MLADDGSFDKLERLTEENPKLATIEKLTGIWGVGPKLAESLYDKGIRSIDKLRE
jgi:predicted flap endonuclease-1-like 5' DNA nuclease